MTSPIAQRFPNNADRNATDTFTTRILPLFVHRDLHSSPALAALQVQVPPLGESITDGVVAAVLKHAGDAVEEDEPLVQIETDKVTIDVRAPAAGVIDAILVSNRNLGLVEKI
jgi:biotin carboxyl carrier protein